MAATISRAEWYPGQVLTQAGDITLNDGAAALELDVVNSGDRPIQVGSHLHFAQANAALTFDRSAAYGRRLDIAAGTARRFEPGIATTVWLVPLAGTREVYGINADAPGRLDAAASGRLDAAAAGHLDTDTAADSDGASS